MSSMTLSVAKNCTLRMKFDEVLFKIGEFGLYQKRVYFLLCLPAVSVGLQIMIQMVFLLAVPKHRCAIPGMLNDTYEVQGELHARLINASIPLRFVDGGVTYSECLVYSNFNLTHTDCSGDNTTSLPQQGDDHGCTPMSYVDDESNETYSTDANNSTEQCHNWVFDKSTYGSTVASEFTMVCERRLYVVHAKMVVMVGMFVGSLVSGPISDILGRKTVLIGGMIGNIFGSICITWSFSYIVFLLLIFIVCGASQGAYIASFVFGSELVGPSKRRFTGIIMNLFWSIGNLLVAAIVFFYRDWKYRQLVFSLPAILFLSYFWIIPESPRWLLMRNRKKEAEKIIVKMAKTNKHVIEKDMLDSVVARETVDVQPFWKLFQSKVLIFRCIIIFFNWFTVGMGFYGMSINIVNLSGNVYANYLIFNVFEFTAYMTCILLVDRLGRKKLHCFSMLISGVACSLTIIPRLLSHGNHPWIITVMATIGNTGVCAAYATVYLYSLELFPTVARNSGMGVGSTFAKLGSIASPYIADLGLIIGGQFGNNLPLLIFGGILIIAGLLSLLLPETFNTNLPETISDAEMLGKRPPCKQTEQELRALTGAADCPSI